MFRSHASPIETKVVYHQPRGDGANLENVSEPMRDYITIPIPKHPVTVNSFASNPKPTLSRCINLLPEALRSRWKVWAAIPLKSQIVTVAKIKGYGRPFAVCTGIVQ